MQCVLILYRCDREMSVDESEPEKVVQVLALDALPADTNRWSCRPVTIAMYFAAIAEVTSRFEVCARTY